MDVKTLIFVALTVFVAWKLWSVLGETTGEERPPLESREPRPPVERLPLPDADAADTPSGGGRWAGLVAEGSEQEAGLNAIAGIDSKFDAEEFLEGARSAYELLVTAFAKGDRETLQEYLSRDVYASFDQALKQREAMDEQVSTTFVSIDKADITKVEVRERTAFITVSFASKMITSTRDSQGHVVDGDPNSIVEVFDIWTFSRTLGRRDPNWILVDTQEGGQT
ncbi:MAG: Tim44/TimA family putative adaptor protein [Methylobacteriaceae bacterium]|jgi:predicted lipid-binding transport protein (Tim44 family)|nr:Tim44/TimA family putative adaptor protein [Methylobacteriaceae bacterium]